MPIEPLPRLFGRALCAVGRHAWEIDRYWSIADVLVEGRVCRRCSACHPDGRRVIFRPNERPDNWWSEQRAGF